MLSMSSSRSKSLSPKEKSPLDMRYCGGMKPSSELFVVLSVWSPSVSLSSSPPLYSWSAASPSNGCKVIGLRLNDDELTNLSDIDRCHQRDDLPKSSLRICPPFHNVAGKTPRRIWSLLFSKLYLSVKQIFDT